MVISSTDPIPSVTTPMAILGVTPAMAIARLRSERCPSSSVTSVVPIAHAAWIPIE
jgi:hypothetical protein